MIGKTENEVRKIIRELEEENIILKYQTVIDWEKAGVENVEAVIDVRVNPQRDIGFKTCASKIYNFPEVKSVYLMSGAYDLSVVVEGKTMKDVALFVAEKLATIDNVLTTTTHFRLKTYKKDGVIYNNDGDDQRMVVSP
jgi:DNA-binding Lrp family transcriptional regulator